MKSTNNHPQWFNQPLRLSKEEKHNPHMVIEAFFDSYHLQDVRQILWRWLVAVISSSLSISSEPLERNNHIYFYEKLEELVEAALVMKRRMKKRSNKKRRRYFNKNSHFEKVHTVEPKENTQSHKTIPVSETIEVDEILNKPKQLTEYVKDAPLYVISEVFKSESLPSLLEQLRDWLHVALSADYHIYEDGEQRRQLLAFHEQLQLLVEALFIILTRNTESTDAKEQTKGDDKTRLLSQDQIANPMQVVIAFFERFPTGYIMRELNDWLEAGIAYAGPYPDNMNEMQALLTFRDVLCLVKSANRLLQKAKK